VDVIHRMTGELLILALPWIRELPRFAHRSKMAVVIDQAPCHMTVDVAMAAAQLSMALIPVPPGSTGGRQPMDVRVLGVVKRKQSKVYDGAMTHDPWPMTHGCMPGRAWTQAGPGPRQMRSARLSRHGEIDANVVQSAWRRARCKAEGLTTAGRSRQGQ
jgi:hypothetical protein